MDPRHLFMDQRLTGFCVYCGGSPDTHDHVPSKVLLDEPYPSNLPTVEACEHCNGGFSVDEQYLACFVECVLCGSAEPFRFKRPNIKRILDESPTLLQRLQESKQSDLFGNPLWRPEKDRIKKIILKLARGHAAYELYPKLEDPAVVGFVPLPLLDDGARAEFENVTSARIDLLPEMGSRAFLRVFGKQPDRFESVGNWIIVQPERYRYAVVETTGILVRIVLSEYFYCQVLWK
jgi:hypothetical protein